MSKTQKWTVLLVAAMAIAMVGVIALPANARFQVRCFTSHIAQVDPIVSPGARSAHEHEFFGNRSTNKDSTYATMVRASTNCSASADTAGYWTPTAFRSNGSRVLADSLLIYYRGDRQTVAFPRNLRIISDRIRSGADSSNLIVKFPDCWDGRRLDSRNHRDHMTFSTGKGCPSTHPVSVPAITEVFRYPVDVDSLHLSSGSLATAHADFWNTWQQPELVRLVDRCINVNTDCGRIDE